jgi:hypothetical protein
LCAGRSAALGALTDCLADKDNRVHGFASFRQDSREANGGGRVQESGMSKVFFHLGAHKTGSSFIQDNLGGNKKKLRRQGWRFVRLRRDYRPAHDEIVEMREGKTLPAARVLDEFFAEMRVETRNLLISSEGFLGDMSIVANRGVLYPHHQAMLARLKNGVAGKDIAIGFCIRDFGSYLESTYSQLVLAGETCDFAHYLAAASVEKLSWLPVIEHMIEMFGLPNVRIWLFEDFKKDAIGAFNAIAKFASIDATKLDMRYQGEINASFPPHTIPVAIALNKVLKEHPVRGKNDKLRRKMRDLLSRAKTSEVQKPLLNSELRAQFTAQYNREVDTIREKWPSVLLPLGKALA